MLSALNKDNDNGGTPFVSADGGATRHRVRWEGGCGVPACRENEGLKDKIQNDYKVGFWDIYLLMMCHHRGLCQHLVVNYQLWWLQRREESSSGRKKTIGEGFCIS
jgi:hypothetical protein